MSGEKRCAHYFRMGNILNGHVHSLAPTRERENSVFGNADSIAHEIGLSAVDMHITEYAHNFFCSDFIVYNQTKK